MRRRSRLSSYQDKRNKRTIIFSIAGIVIVLIVLVKFGIPALINFSLLLSGNKNDNSNISQNQVGYIAPPILNALPQATNSARVIITGKSNKDTNVILYINRKEKDNIDVTSDGGFEFDENLSKGDNLVQVKAKKGDKTSDFSNFYTVTYINGNPKLDVSSPHDGDQFHKVDTSVNVTGQTDSNVTVTVNGFTAVIDESNNFSYNLQLHDGDNPIDIIAVDAAGNRSEKTLKVNYSQ